MLFFLLRHSKTQLAHQFQWSSQVSPAKKKVLPQCPMKCLERLNLVSRGYSEYGFHLRLFIFFCPQFDLKSFNPFSASPAKETEVNSKKSVVINMDEIGLIFLLYRFINLLNFRLFQFEPILGWLQSYKIKLF